MVALGVILHAVGGFAAGSFYIPFKKVRYWAWESYWLAGGFTTNFIWCVFLNVKNHTAKDYLNKNAPLPANYLFSALAGITWYFQFTFYGMGETTMGEFGFSSWTIHLAFIIVFSNIWGLIFREWKGSSRPTHRLILCGILVLVASILVVGAGNYLKKAQEEAAEPTSQYLQAVNATVR